MVSAMSHILINSERCKGCFLCVRACPRQLIGKSDRINRSGYQYAYVPEDKMKECTACASCALTCPDVAIEVYRTAKEDQQ